MNTYKNIFLIITAFLIFSGCAPSLRFTGERFRQPIVDKNISNSNNNSSSSATEGIASYYADQFHGKKAANGEIFDMHTMVAAHRTFPFGSIVKVTNLENKKIVNVRIIDRGPFKLERIIDLSLGAAKEIDMVKTGTAKVSLELISIGDNKYQK
ncbi:MAG: septal ring lytic transglycosylase RlpA family protein [Bacteroidetes bacterium]|nr:septal ring lytic transglycosylase RlpA family protein [Bacteroidota bacterium]